MPSDDLVEVCLITMVEVDSDITNVIKTGYSDDRLLSLVIANPERYPEYSVRDD